MDAHNEPDVSYRTPSGSVPRRVQVLPSSYPLLCTDTRASRQYPASTRAAQPSVARKCRSRGKDARALARRAGLCGHLAPRASPSCDRAPGPSTAHLHSRSKQRSVAPLQFSRAAPSPKALERRVSHTGCAAYVTLMSAHHLCHEVQLPVSCWHGRAAAARRTRRLLRCFALSAHSNKPKGFGKRPDGSADTDTGAALNAEELSVDLGVRSLLQQCTQCMTHSPSASTARQVAQAAAPTQPG